MVEGARENLVLVHSFPTNSNLLAGFYEYLGCYFNVCPIDLPGFTRGTPPLDVISIPNYAQFVQNQIQNLSLGRYLLGGISFGFAVVNSIVLDQRCKGLLAMEPYLNLDSLDMSTGKRFIYRSLLKLADVSGLIEKLWGSKALNILLGAMIGYPSDRIEALTSQVHARTFLKTAQVILENTDPPKFHDLPYALAINPSDCTVNYDQLVNTFRRGVSSLHLVHTQVDHYPKDMTPNYFKERIKSEDIWGMIDWFKCYHLP